MPMTLMKVRRWHDWINLILSTWMLIAPMVLGFVHSAATATWTAWILGGASFTYVQVAPYLPQTPKETINLLLGVCLIASPWALGFQDYASATTNSVVTGLAMTALALWIMTSSTAARRWMHEHHWIR